MHSQRKSVEFGKLVNVLVWIIPSSQGRTRTAIILWREYHIYCQKGLFVLEFEYEWNANELGLNFHRDKIAEEEKGRPKQNLGKGFRLAKVFLADKMVKEKRVRVFADDFDGFFEVDSEGNVKSLDGSLVVIFDGQFEL